MRGLGEADRLVTTYEAAKVLCCSIAWLERQRWKGEPPVYVKIGGQGGRMVRYRLSDLLAWVDANLVTGAASPK